MESNGLPTYLSITRVAEQVYADAGPDNRVGSIRAELAGVPSTEGLFLVFDVFKDTASAQQHSFNGEPGPTPPTTGLVPVSRGTAWCDSDQYGARCFGIEGDVFVTSGASARDLINAPNGWSATDAQALVEVGLTHVIALEKKGQA